MQSVSKASAPDSERTDSLAAAPRLILEFLGYCRQRRDDVFDQGIRECEVDLKDCIDGLKAALELRAETVNERVHELILVVPFRSFKVDQVLKYVALAYDPTD